MQRYVLRDPRRRLVRSQPDPALGPSPVLPDTPETPTQQIQHTAVARLTPKAKLQVLSGMIQRAWDLKEAWLRLHNPDASAEEVRRPPGAWSVTRPPDLIELFIRPLEPLGVEYRITGGVAAVIQGDPRFTRDLDLVLELGR